MRFEDKLLRWRKFAEICSKFSSETFYDYPLLSALQTSEIETELEEIVSQFFVENLEMSGQPYKGKKKGRFTLMMRGTSRVMRMTI